MPVNYDSIIEKLAQDPEFLELSPEDQDQLVEELAQEQMGVIPKSENLLQRAMKASQGFTQGFADVSTLGGTALARGAAEKLVPLPPQAEERYQELTEADPASYAVGAAIPIARGAQQLGSMGINALFGKQLAKKALPKATGKLSESIQEVIKRSQANPAQANVPKNEMLKVLEEGLAKSKEPYGEQATHFRRWIRGLKTPGKYPDELTADIISEIETVFGKAAKFGKGVNNPILQQSAKEVNRYASGRMDILAKKTGVPEFIKRSAEKSKLLKAANNKPSGINKLINNAVKATIIGGSFEGGRRVISRLFD